MTSGRFLRYGVLLALAPAILAVALSGRAGVAFTSILHPALVFVCALLSLWVANMYRSDLRRAFLLLSTFFTSYGLANVDAFVAQLRTAMGDAFLGVVFFWQVITYTVLLAACVFVLRAIGAGKLTRGGFAVLGVLAAAAVGTVASAIPQTLDLYETDPISATLFLFIRVGDMVAMLLLVPVLLRYIQGAKAKYQESTSFVVIAAGITSSLVLAYFYELVRGMPLSEIALAEFHQGSVLDGLYIFGYVTVAAGLIAHRKHQEWSFASLDERLESD